jgi:hypothetical protein
MAEGVAGSPEGGLQGFPQARFKMCRFGPFRFDVPTAFSIADGRRLAAAATCLGVLAVLTAPAGPGRLQAGRCSIQVWKTRNVTDTSLAEA